MSAITFNIQQGGLGRRLPGLDYVSGFLFAFTDAQLPAGFGTGDRIKKVESIDEAEALGIVSTSVNLEIKVLHYHVSEFFLMYGGKTGSIGTLWINLFDNQSAMAAADFTDLQTAAGGDIRQFYAWTNVTYAASLVTTAGTAAETMLQNKVPAVIVIGADFSASTVATLASVRALAVPYVSVDISQDGAAIPNALFVSLTKSIGGGGALLGIIAASKVSTNIGYVKEFNIADSVRWQTIKIATGEIYSELTAANVNSLATLGFVFARTRTGINGAFYNDSPQAVLVDNDFAYIENARTIQKAVRQTNAQLVPFINAPLQINAVTGKISETTIFELESAVFKALNQMGADFELSVDPSTGRLPLNAVFIDPDQNVLATSKVNIIVRLVPLGVQRETVINIGFTPKLNTAA